MISLYKLLVSLPSLAGPELMISFSLFKGPPLPEDSTLLTDLSLFESSLPLILIGPPPPSSQEYPVLLTAFAPSEDPLLVDPRSLANPRLFVNFLLSKESIETVLVVSMFCFHPLKFL